MNTFINVHPWVLGLCMPVFSSTYDSDIPFHDYDAIHELTTQLLEPCLLLHFLLGVFVIM